MRSLLGNMFTAAADNPKNAFYIFLILLILACWVANGVIRRNKLAPRRVDSPDPEKPLSREGSIFKAPERNPGQWIPMNFKCPVVAPYHNWDVHDTEPLPYRPFKYGPHHITMGLRTMKWDEWIELDNQYLEWHAIKAKRIQERGDKCCRTAPEAFDGAVELLEELCSYLPQRYPTLYRAIPDGMTNLLTHETFSLTPPLSEDPMAMAARMVQDDLAIMFERADGQYYLLAGSILLAGFWRLSEKFGMPLSEIHTSGNVPGFKTKLEKGMTNFFRRVQPHNPVLRHNYFIQVDNDLAWSQALGPEDANDSDDPIAPGVITTTQGSGWNNSLPAPNVATHMFRTERQSLRRLPRSGAVVFTIRTYFEPITKVAREPGVPGRLASAIRSWGDDTARYKGRDKYGAALLAFLDRCHGEQVERGEVGVGEVEGERQNAKYPF